jgi:hypothetical protein
MTYYEAKRIVKKNGECGESAENCLSCGLCSVFPGTLRAILPYAKRFVDIYERCERIRDFCKRIKSCPECPIADKCFKCDINLLFPKHWSERDMNILTEQIIEEDKNDK